MICSAVHVRYMLFYCSLPLIFKLHFNCSVMFVHTNFTSFSVRTFWSVLCSASFLIYVNDSYLNFLQYYIKFIFLFLAAFWPFQFLFRESLLSRLKRSNLSSLQSCHTRWYEWINKVLAALEYCWINVGCEPHLTMRGKKEFCLKNSSLPFISQMEADTLQSSMLSEEAW